MHRVIIAVILILVLLYYMRPHEHMSTKNASFFDSMRDRSADYFYDRKGMTLLDYGLEQQITMGQ